MNIDPSTLAETEFVELIGRRLSVDGVAQRAGTVGYEILTSLGNRFHREYKHSGTKPAVPRNKARIS